MSSYESFDELKAEKADAMRRFKRKRNVLLCLRLAGALFLFLLFCSFTWILGFKIGLASHRLSVVGHQFCVLFLINAIVLLVYRLSADDGKTNKKDAAVQSDLYDQYVSFSSSASAASSRSNATVSHCNQLVSLLAPENLSDVAVCEHVEYSTIEGNLGVRELAVVENGCGDVKAEEEEEEEEEGKHYRRTRSELLITGEKTSRGRQLRRSETENNRRQLVVAADCYSEARKSMEDMNSEEFRHTIESFIATKKKILREENNALLSAERTGLMPSSVLFSTISHN